ASVHLFDLHSFPTRRSSDLLRGPRAERLPRENLVLAELLALPRPCTLRPDPKRPPIQLPHCVEMTAVERQYVAAAVPRRQDDDRSEEHTSELQSLRHLVCRL